MKLLVAALAILAWAGPAPLQAANPGDEVIVVYNSRLPESRGVADHYAALRRVPTNQVFGFDLSTTEMISRSEYRDALQRPLARAIEDQKLWRIASNMVPASTNGPARVEWKPVESKIRYAVLCYGIPLKIARDPNHKDEGGETLRPELRRNEAAVDSELCLLPFIEQRLPLSGPLHNWIYTSTNAAMLHPTNGLLLVTRLDGPSAAIARGLVDKALQGEADGLWGRAYFDVRNTTDPAYKQGDFWIRGAADVCKHLGFETVLDENPGTFPAGFPMSQVAFYAGWYESDVSGPFARPTVEFMPGAFAYHLHSFSGRTLRSTNETWAGPLLARGATITMGCVDEPYLGGTPDVGVFAARLIYHSFTFAEAAYACQPVISWQTTVVGDPLYRPFGKNPDLQHRELVARKSKLVEWSWLRLVNLVLAQGRPPSEGSAMIEQIDVARQSAVLNEKLGDLLAAQGKPSSAIFAWQRALGCDPSPRQRLRLLLTLGDKLGMSDRTQEAFDAYQNILRDDPDYPDKLTVYRKLLPLAQKLGKREDAAKFEAEIARLMPPPPPPPAPPPAAATSSVPVLAPGNAPAQPR